MAEQYDDADAAEAAANPRQAARDYGGLLTELQLRKHIVERLAMDIDSGRMEVEFTHKSGSRIYAPPYDREWAEGNGLAFGSNVDGKVFALTKPNGFSAAGVTFYLTTNESVLAAITPQGTYEWNWFSFEDLPFARSRGAWGSPSTPTGIRN